MAEQYTRMFNRMQRIEDMLDLVHEIKPGVFAIEHYRHILFCLTIEDLPMFRQTCQEYLDELCANNETRRRILYLLSSRILGFDSASIESLGTESDFLAWVDSLP